ncbi:uncharacterized protein LOC143272646 [Peromyscus maniculatus bairdii]|uniref:uncharacterized protein LOC143272646 n=1 Tax=Peromyscus maniculatus bairdii TaxID=230844 RepID=UPI003FD50942
MYLPANLRRKESARARCCPISTQRWGGTFRVPAPGVADRRRSKDGGVRRSPAAGLRARAGLPREAEHLSSRWAAWSGTASSGLTREPAGPGRHRALPGPPRRVGPRRLPVCGRGVLPLPRPTPFPAPFALAAVRSNPTLPDFARAGCVWKPQCWSPTCFSKNVHLRVAFDICSDPFPKASSVKEP